MVIHRYKAIEIKPAWHSQVMGKQALEKIAVGARNVSL